MVTFSSIEMPFAELPCALAVASALVMASGIALVGMFALAMPFVPLAAVTGAVAVIGWLGGPCGGVVAGGGVYLPPPEPLLPPLEGGFTVTMAVLLST